MPVFQYRAMDGTGREASGAIEAASKADALAALNRKGEVPFRLTEQSASLWARLNRPVHLGNRIRQSDILSFTQELARLLEAGVVLERALSILLGTRKKKALRDLISRLLEGVRSGKSFSEALAAEGGLFPLYYVQVVHAGELSGRLEESLARLGALLERRHAFRSGLSSALIYPSILLVLVAVTLFIVIGVVLPEFEAVFANAGAALPLPTRIVMAVGGFFETFGLVMMIAIGAGIAVFLSKLNDESFRLKVDSLLLRVKGIGLFLVKSEMALGLRNLGTMIQNGVALPEAFAMVGETFRNAVIRKDFTEARSGLKEGDSLSQVLSRLPYFPGTSLQMVQIGEETGELGRLLEEAAGLLEREVEVAAKRFLAAFSPAMTLLMGGLIAAIIGAVLLGIMSINELAF